MAVSLSKSGTYALLLVMQTLAILIIVLGMIPIYDEIIAALGHQLRQLPQSPALLIAALLLFHCTYWFRLLRVPIAVSGHSHLLSHVVLFVGRLSFIFGTSLFALIAFRHLPAIAVVSDPLRLALRFVVMLVILFSLYCYSAELERLGVALRPPQHQHH
jgi:hypothetical protein